jgi:protein phosphatase
MTATGAARAASIAGRAGTTLVASIIVNNRAYWASVGDSRIYIYRRGELLQLTRDHNYALVLREMVKNGELAEAEADSDPARNALISFIGMERVAIVDICESPLSLENGDIMLLCSDGLVKALPDEAIAETMSRHFGNLNEMARRLPMAALDAKARCLDNTSVVLLQFME